jgi:hypothetical protein
MMKNDSTPVFFVLLVGLACVLVWLVARRVMEWRRRKQIVDDQRTRMMGQPVPPDIQRDTVRAKSGDFEGEELSPLSYLGYRVGKTNGLRPDARRKRLKICFAIEMPSLLPSKYRRWGRPVTYQRYASIFNHLLMLANQRRGRPNYEFAVSDWEADAKWMESEFGQMVRDLKRYGFKR